MIPRKPLRKTRIPEVHEVTAVSRDEHERILRGLPRGEALRGHHHKKRSENFWPFFLTRIGAIVAIIIVAFLAGYGLKGIKEHGLDWLSLNPAVTPTPAPSLAKPVFENLTQGSFSDSFSGTGWMDTAQTTVTRDNRTMVISFSPNVTWQPDSKLTAELAGETLLATRGNGVEAVLVTQSGKLIISQNSGNILRADLKESDLAAVGLAYDDSTSQWVIVSLASHGNETIQTFRVKDQKLERGETLSIQGLRIAGTPKIDNLLLTVGCSSGKCLIARTPLPLSGPPPSQGESVGVRSGGVSGGGINLASISLAKLSAPETVSLSNAKSIVGLTVNAGKGEPLVGITHSTSSKYTSEIYRYTNNKLTLLPISHENASDKSDKSDISSEYPGLTRAAYDSKRGTVMKFYNGYFGQAVDTRTDTNATTSYTRYLGARLLGGDAKGEVVADLEPFAWGDAWWAGNSVLPLAGGVSGGLPLPTSPVRGGVTASRAVLLHLQNGLGLDLTSTAPSNLNIGQAESIQVVPGVDAQTVLAFITSPQGITVYRVTDYGFKEPSPATWTSVKVNNWDKPVVRARIYRADDSAGTRTGTNGDARTITNGGTNGSEQVRYFLSNNGGKDWTYAKPGEVINFSTPGSDLRYKIELEPGSDTSVSPWVTQIGVEYWLENTN